MNFRRSSVECLRTRDVYNLFVPHNQATLQRIDLLAKQFGLIKQIVQIRRRGDCFFNTKIYALHHSWTAPRSQIAREVVVHGWRMCNFYWAYSYCLRCQKASSVASTYVYRSLKAGVSILSTPTLIFACPARGPPLDIAMLTFFFNKRAKPKRSSTSIIGPASPFCVVLLDD